MNPDKKLKMQLIEMLTGEHAHVNLDNALKGIPEKLLGLRPDRIPYSIWQLTEHIRITQWDIVEFCLDKNHISPPWPEGHWPKKEMPEDMHQWRESLKAIKKDREAFIDLLKNPHTDLLKPIEHGEGQTLLREALLIIDHTSYHTGEIIVVRRLLGVWN